MSIIYSKTVGLSNGTDVTVNRHTGYDNCDSITLSVRAAAGTTSNNTHYTVEQARGLFFALGEALKEKDRA